MFRSPAILQGADPQRLMGGRVDFANGTLEDKKKGARNIAEAVKKFAEQSPIPVVLHLDHGDSCVAAIEGGYTSVMIDGSALPFEENVELTREVVKYAHARGVSVEGELGVLAGVEDHVFAANSTYTNPLSAIEFFKKTGVDALAISYGTMHGASKGKDVKLRKEIPIAIKECMNHEGIQGALVSHGSSTVPQYIVNAINALGGNIQNALRHLQGGAEGGHPLRHRQDQRGHRHPPGRHPQLPRAVPRPPGAEGGRQGGRRLEAAGRVAGCL